MSVGLYSLLSLKPLPLIHPCSDSTLNQTTMPPALPPEILGKIFKHFIREIQRRGWILTPEINTLKASCLVSKHWSRPARGYLNQVSSAMSDSSALSLAEKLGNTTGLNSQPKSLFLGHALSSDIINRVLTKCQHLDCLVLGYRALDFSVEVHVSITDELFPPNLKGTQCTLHCSD